MKHQPIVFVLTACIGVIGSNSLVLGPIAPRVAATFDVDIQAVTAGIASYGIATAAAALLLARLIDSQGPRRMLLAAFAVLTVAMVASAAAPTSVALVAAQGLAGCAAGVALPAIYSYAAAVSPTGRESATMGLVLTGWTLSLVAGVSVFSLIADLVHWRLVYTLLATLVALNLGLLLLATKREDRPRGRGTNASPLAALAVPGVRRLLLACAAFMSGFYGAYAYLGDHIDRGLGLSTAAAGLVTLSYGIGFGAAAVLDGMLERLGAARAASLAFAFLTAVYVTLALATASYTSILAVAFLWGLANHLALNALILRLTRLDPGRRGAIMGLNSAVTYLAGFVGTLTFGALYPVSGFLLLPLAAAGLCIVATVAVWQPEVTQVEVRAR